MDYKDSKGRSIQVDSKPIASGGEGIIYKVISPLIYKDCCVKIYKEGKINSRLPKLTYMVGNRIPFNTNLNYKICWPIDLVFSGGKAVGYIMDMAFEGSRSLYELYLKDKTEKYNKGTDIGIRNRLKLLYNIACSIAILQYYGHVIVDFKPQNLLYTRSGKISLIDIDSIQLSDSDKLLFSAVSVQPQVE